MKEVQATGEAFSPQKKTYSTSKHGICFFVVHFALLDPDPADQIQCRSIRIRIHNTGCMVTYGIYVTEGCESYY
jgi:hypothetical protein